MSLDSVPWGFVYVAIIAFVWGWSAGTWIAACKMKALAAKCRSAMRQISRINKQMTHAYRASLRRALRVNVDVETHMINHTQAITRIAINNKYKLVITTSADTPLDIQVVDNDGPMPVNEHTVSNAVN